MHTQLCHKQYVIIPNQTWPSRLIVLEKRDLTQSLDKIAYTNGTLKMQNDNTKTPPKYEITERLRTDLIGLRDQTFQLPARGIDAIKFEIRNMFETIFHQVWTNEYDLKNFSNVFRILWYV